jgi:cobalamin biosynthesis Mg chelatase CobN
VIGIVYYRAHELAGNTTFVDTVAQAVLAAGGTPVPVFCASLRELAEGLLGALTRCDALVVTVLAAGGTVATDAGAGGSDDAWDVGALAALDVPVLQALLPDQHPRAMGRRHRRAVATGRRDAGGDPGVRRPDHHRVGLENLGWGCDLGVL